MSKSDKKYQQIVLSDYDQNGAAKTIKVSN